MKLSERMKAVATKRSIRTPAIWTILKDYAEEVEGLEAELTSMEDAVSVFKRVRELEADLFQREQDCIDRTVEALALEAENEASIWVMAQIKKRASQMIDGTSYPIEMFARYIIEMLKALTDEAIEAVDALLIREEKR